MNISIVIPLFNDEESLSELCSWIGKVMQENKYTYEVLLIDDGSKDSSWNVIENIGSTDSSIKGIKFQVSVLENKILIKQLSELDLSEIIIILNIASLSLNEIDDLFKQLS